MLIDALPKPFIYFIVGSFTAFYHKLTLFFHL